jgi:hypothetical protein
MILKLEISPLTILTFFTTGGSIREAGLLTDALMAEKINALFISVDFCA